MAQAITVTIAMPLSRTFLIMLVHTFATSAGGTTVSRESPLDALIVTETVLPMIVTMPTSKEEFVIR